MSVRLTEAEAAKMNLSGAKIGRRVGDALRDLPSRPTKTMLCFKGEEIEMKVPGESEKKKPSRIRTYKSKAERDFVQRLKYEQDKGLILKWRYEGIRFQLLDAGQEARTYEADFLAWLPNGRFRVYEVKGKRPLRSDYATRDAFAWCRQQYAGPLLEFVAYRQNDYGWEEIWKDDRESP